MYVAGAIDGTEYQAALASDLGLDPTSAVHDGYAAPYFVDYVNHWFLNDHEFGPDRQARYDLLFKGGLRIYTTVDMTLQREAERAIRSILIRPSDPYAAMTVIDPRTGEIKAMVGGRDYFSHRDPVARLNLATGRENRDGFHAFAQAGSSFKPFALVTALEQGIQPLRVYSAPSRITIPLPRGGPQPIWTVDNYDGEGGGSMTLEDATIHSINTVYAQLIMQVGPANVVSTAYRMGITTKLLAYPSAVLGTNEVNTVEMASAYGTLATLGQYAEPVAVTRIVDAHGNLIYEHTPRPAQVLDPAVAWTADQILRKVVQGGTGIAANIGRPAAGKTGTAQNWTSAWFVGFVPQLVAAVWVGFPEPVSMVAPRVRIPHVTGGTWPAQIWHAFMVNATRDLAVLDFPRPSIDFVDVAVDVLRNCLPNQWTLPRDIGTVRFISGTAPTQVCLEPSGPQEVSVPSVVGLTQEDAAAKLTTYGFLTSIQLQVVEGAPAGTVLAQDPGAGVAALQGTTVTLTVAGPGSGPPIPIDLPDVVGLPWGDARAVLRESGFKVEVVNDWQCSPPELCGAVADTVWHQDPTGGEKVDPGSTVTIWVNRDAPG